MRGRVSPYDGERRKVRGTLAHQRNPELELWVTFRGGRDHGWYTDEGQAFWPLETLSFGPDKVRPRQPKLAAPAPSMRTVVFVTIVMGLYIAVFWAIASLVTGR